MAAREIMLRLGGKGPDSTLIMPVYPDEKNGKKKPLRRVRRRKGGKVAAKGGSRRVVGPSVMRKDQLGSDTASSQIV
jgi:hypothetical protein